jgi:ABC-type protease/lipase transport system fused ATPase/permease subunit
MATGLLTAAARPAPWVSWVGVVLVACVCVALGGAWLWSSEQSRQAMARTQALYLAQNHAQALRRNVERMLTMRWNRWAGDCRWTSSRSTSPSCATC